MKRTKNKQIIGLITALLFCCSLAEAKVKLPVILSDGMVLQREKPLKIWGTADKGEVIEVTFKGNASPTAVKGGKVKSRFSTVTNADGSWEVALPPLKPGGPYIMQINDQVLNDIYIGDVFLCSGQSNMELPVRRVAEAFQEEITTYNNEKIRHIIIPKEFNFHEPQSDVSATGWKGLNQENVPNFSAIAYFFAKSLIEKSNVPVGLINASWGGTPVQSWISEESLADYPYYLNEKRLYENDDYLRQIKQLESQNFMHWNNTLYKGDPGLHESTPWYAKDYDDSTWENKDLFSTDWNNNGLNPINGSHWFRKDIDLTADWSNEDATLRLGYIIDADSVYVNGVFVGTTSYQYPPRIYNVPAGLLKEGKNNITMRVISNNGAAKVVHDKPYKLIGSNGEIDLTGNWKYRLGTPMPQAPGMMFFCYKPVGLYNAMIAPLKNLAIDGVIWYQGESNVSTRNEYTSLLSKMIADWRKTFDNPTLPFYIVELADFLEPDNPARPAWAEMRAIQAKVAETNENTYLITNSDTGEWNDIHPLDKKTPGQRVAAKVLENQ